MLMWRPQARHNRHGAVLSDATTERHGGYRSRESRRPTDGVFRLHHQDWPYLLVLINARRLPKLPEIQSAIWIRMALYPTKDRQSRPGLVYLALSAAPRGMGGWTCTILNIVQAQSLWRERLPSFSITQQ